MIYIHCHFLDAVIIGVSQVCTLMCVSVFYDILEVSSLSGYLSVKREQWPKQPLRKLILYQLFQAHRGSR